MLTALREQTAPARLTRKISPGKAVTGLKINYYLEKMMSKERKSNREDKKQPAMTPKEKKAAKKSRKEARGILGEHGG